MLKQIKKLIMGKEESILEEDIIQDVVEQEKFVQEQVEREIGKVDQDIKELESLDDLPTEEVSEEEASDFLKYSAESVGYNNRESQWNTYRTVLNYIPAGSSILDFGCGRGDLYSLHVQEFGPLDYYGVDMNQPMIEAGQEQYEDIKDNLVLVDWNNIANDIKKDWCVNIGSSNLRYDANIKDNDFTYLCNTLKKMYLHAEKGVIALLTSGDNNDGLINHDPGKVLNWAQKEFGNVIVDHSVSKDGFCLIIYK